MSLPSLHYLLLNSQMILQEKSSSDLMLKPGKGQFLLQPVKKQFKVWNILPRTFLVEGTDWVTDSYNISFSSKSKITLWFDVGFWHPSQRLPSVLWTVSLEFTLLSGLQQTLFFWVLLIKLFTAVTLLKRSLFALHSLDENSVFKPAVSRSERNSQSAS